MEDICWTLPGSDTNYKVADDEQVVVKVRELKHNTLYLPIVCCDLWEHVFFLQQLTPMNSTFMQIYIGGLQQLTDRLSFQL